MMEVKKVTDKQEIWGEKEEVAKSVFFVEKKDNKKCIVQNYRYLNKWKIKNNYSLPLILNIVENIGTKKVFTKLDLWQGYNNV